MFCYNTDSIDNASYTHFEQNVVKSLECPYCHTVGKVVPIDHDIIDSILLFNRKGWHTVSSCSGHYIKTSDDMLDYVTKCFKEKKFPLWGEDELEGCIAYEKRFIGFLSERIFNIYVEHNFKRPFIIPYSKFIL